MPQFEYVFPPSKYISVPSLVGEPEKVKYIFRIPHFVHMFHFRKGERDG